ncbi:MAG: M3 family oligoendopeptidase [bacterium]|nr:M3 family oligoendopeptidase [bacterium]
MMLDTLPRDPTALFDAPWETFQPHWDALAAVELSTANVAAWLEAWSRLHDLIIEIGARLNVAISRDTADSAAEARYHAFVSGVQPHARKMGNALKEKLIASGLEPGHFAIPLRNMRAEAALFRESNLPLQVEEETLRTQFDKITGAQTFSWQGETYTIPALAKLLQHPDRAFREGAWRAAHDRILADRATYNALWTKFVPLRAQMARNAGFDTYRDYAWQLRLRFDYRPEDSLRFHDAIEQKVVPAARELRRRQSERLKIDSVRPWDLVIDPFAETPLRPFADETEFIDRAQSVFDQLDPQLGTYFRQMRDSDMLDLMSRPHKRPGGYCATLPVTQRPFIFMNAVGVGENIRTLFHEAGHAFHAFEKFALPFTQQRLNTAEFNEVASMAMELLTFPYWERDKGGYYSPADATRAKIDHLEKIINFWPYMAVVDAFQHWVYTHTDQAADPDQCDAAWSALWDRFMPSEDWSGLDAYKVTGWHRKLHIFNYPFYYVEYGMAQIGAVQIYANMLRDQPGALAAYKRALALGGTRGLPELYTAAGAQFAFTSETVGAAVELIMGEIDKLEAQVTG